MTDTTKKTTDIDTLNTEEPTNTDLIVPIKEDNQPNSLYFEKILNQLAETIEKRPITNAIINTIEQAKSFFQKTGKMLEEERSFSISEDSINGLLGRFLVSKVELIKELSAQIFEENFKLVATIETHGIKADVSALFEVVTFTVNENEQKMVYKQITPTEIHSILFDSVIKNIGAKVYLWFLTVFKKRDVLGIALEKAEVAEIEAKRVDGQIADIITIDLNRYLADDKTIMKTIKRVNITDASIKNNKLNLVSQVKLDGLLNEL